MGNEADGRATAIFNEYYPDRYYNHDAEDDDNLVTLGHTRHNEPLRVNKRAIEGDLLIYLNINLVDGWRLEIGRGRPVRL